MGLQYGTEEHEQFARLVEQLRNDLATRLADSTPAAAGMESNPLTRGLYGELVEFLRLCENAKATGIEPWKEKYQTKARALAVRVRDLDAGKRFLDDPGRSILQYVLAPAS